MLCQHQHDYDTPSEQTQDRYVGCGHLKLTEEPSDHVLLTGRRGGRAANAKDLDSGISSW